MKTKTIVIRFAGDSGDGIQIIGTQMMHSSAMLGNDIHTLPDFPAEIRAPAGTVGGVSGFQLCFSAKKVHTAGDKLDALVAFNPAALKVSVDCLVQNGLLIIDSDKFVQRDLEKAGYTTNPLIDLDLPFRLIDVPMTTLTLKATESFNLARSSRQKCKNLFALGMVYWIYCRKVDATLQWLEEYYKNKPEVVRANQAAFKKGFHYAETTEICEQILVEKAKLAPGKYRAITGNQAVALAALSASQQSDLGLLVASYPITPASDILMELAKYAQFGVSTFQAEDEVAAICACIGAAFGGSLALTATSGPGFDLKAEGLGLAAMLELPLLVINVQRAGPSTGMPTKVEQSDLFAALYSRHGESPIPVLAPASPSDCFNITFEAFRLAIKYMTPVIVLSDSFLANSAEPWRIPDFKNLPKLNIQYAIEKNIKKNAQSHFNPYQRNKNCSRPWAIPGTKGLTHRLGGLEKHLDTGIVNYEPENHAKMTQLRRRKIQAIQSEIPSIRLKGEEKGEILLVSWGSTEGVIETAVEILQQERFHVSWLHLRFLNPLPKNLTAIFKNFRQIIALELNTGQLTQILKSVTLQDIKCFSKVQGTPFSIEELVEMVKSL